MCDAGGWLGQGRTLQRVAELLARRLRVADDALDGGRRREERGDDRDEEPLNSGHPA